MALAKREPISVLIFGEIPDDFGGEQLPVDPQSPLNALLRDKQNNKQALLQRPHFAYGISTRKAIYH